MTNLADADPVNVSAFLLRRITVFVTILLFVPALAFGQAEKVSAVCTQNVFAARKQLPKLEYTCSETLTESDGGILRLPRRRVALARVIETLRSFTNPAWWEASVDELNACDLRGSAGELSEEEKGRWQSGDYSFTLFGDGQTRLALLADPCYQTGYNGSNAFLLHRQDGQVFVTQVLDGYYSRADNSVGIDFANLNGERIIEVATSNSMPPSLTYYYFVLDRKTNRAVPRKIFKEGGKLTNQIGSAMLLDAANAGPELKIISRNRLNRSFSAYHDSERGRIDDNGRKLRRVVYRWNGRFFSPAR